MLLFLFYPSNSISFEYLPVKKTYPQLEFQ